MIDRTISSLPIALLAVLSCALAGCAPQPSSESARVSPTPTPYRAPIETINTVQLAAISPPAGTFFTLPYLQLGNSPRDMGALAIVWHAPGTAVKGKDWSIETRSPIDSGEWKSQKISITTNPVQVQGMPPHTVCIANISGLAVGEPFDYQISKAGKLVFAARVNRARPDPTQAFRMVLFGDAAANTPAQRKIAYQTSLLKPDAVLLTGDLVYPEGRASEYRDHFFPIYNAATAAPDKGAPLLRSTLFIGASGNHDLDATDLTRYPDGLAYYYYWQQPQNGFGTASGKADHPVMTGSTGAFLKASGANYPYGANFTFDYGNAHFVVIDSSASVNWSDPTLQNNLQAALTARPDATWRFVVFHVAPFHSSVKHQDEQWMRVLCPLLESCKVDVVFSGHVHNYQRTYPLRFKPMERPEANGKIRGAVNISSDFDGVNETQLNGSPLYLVTGAGGAPLYPETYHKDSTSASGTLQPFTAKYIADTHSLTVAEVNGKTLLLRQISEDGKELDRITVTK